ncbi:MAG TPA: ATP-binding protein [Gemmatimonadaceae bacterium]|jgi:K+-sensing histidine kinase KdpD|nr:ATP-binding protein [Gemmatimonadaceae bacterium]
MTNGSSENVKRPAVAVALTIAALGVTLVIQPILGSEPSLMFVAAVALSTRYGGRGAGLLSGALSVLALDYFFVPPLGSIDLSHPTQLMHLVVFLFIALLVGESTAALRRARLAAEGNAERLEQLNIELERQMEEIRELDEDLHRTNEQLTQARDAAQRVASRATKLQAVTAALSTAQTASEVADVLLDRGLPVLQASRGLVCGLSADGQFLEEYGRRGFASLFKSRPPRVPLTDPYPVSLAARTREVVWLQSPEDYRIRFPDIADTLDFDQAPATLVAIPLIHRDEVVGALGVSFSDVTAVGAADQAFTLLLAQATADALYRARGFDTEREQRHEAELAARAREEVLGVVAHDLRNPIHLLGSTAELLADPKLEENERPDLLQVSKRAVRQMDRLIGDLLDTARLQAGRFSLQLKDVKASRLLRQAEETFRQMAADKKIQFEVSVPAQDLTLRADEDRAAQVLGNLLGNAFKFTPAGGRVTLSVSRSDGDAQFHVADTGPGLSEEQIGRLFERFWQGRPGDRRGVGLGLTIARGIVEAHAGRMWVDSTPGNGSTFSFSLPLASQQADAFAENRGGHAAD